MVNRAWKFPLQGICSGYSPLFLLRGPGVERLSGSSVSSAEEDEERRVEMCLPQIRESSIRKGREMQTCNSPPGHLLFISMLPVCIIPSGLAKGPRQSAPVMSQHIMAIMMPPSLPPSLPRTGQGSSFSLVTAGNVASPRKGNADRVIHKGVKCEGGGRREENGLLLIPRKSEGIELN